MTGARSNAEVHAKVMAKLRAMSADERVQTLIDAGILKEDRSVASKYATAPLLSYRTPSGTPE